MKKIYVMKINKTVFERNLKIFLKIDKHFLNLF